MSRRLFLRRPADFYDMNGIVIELGMQAVATDYGICEICAIDEDSVTPIGVGRDISSQDGFDLAWFSPDDIELLC